MLTADTAAGTRASIIQAIIYWFTTIITFCTPCIYYISVQRLLVVCLENSVRITLYFPNPRATCADCPKEELHFNIRTDPISFPAVIEMCAETVLFFCFLFVLCPLRSGPNVGRLSTVGICKVSHLCGQIVNTNVNVCTDWTMPMSRNFLLRLL